ncbi:hypothetical protein B484DRAFT_327541 [Ochromonadaceae sp. CCMP2298]|nr:hypothetical protein B484DRAFT_327541 [Ochromonadaceae sp. CCMP2298]
MKLLSVQDDYCLLKVRLVLSLTGDDATVETGIAQEDLSKLDASAQSMVLETSSGYVTQTIPVMRYLAQAHPKAKLQGSGEVDTAMIDQWLEFSWQELEVPVQLLLSLQSGGSVAAKAKTDVFNNLSVLDEHLSTRTYMVGERVSLADLSLFAAYRAVLELKAADASLLPSLFRWFMTVGSLPAVKAVVGTSSPVGATMAVVAPGAGKWGRGRVRVKELLQRGEGAIGEQVVLKGWIRTARSAEKGAMLFVELTDGSTVRGVQLVFNATSSGMQAVADAGGVGASLSVKGAVVASIAKGQTIEVLIREATVLGAVYGGDNGEVGGKNYPMSKKMHGLEFLREKAHLRPRSKVFSSALRVRHAMAFATHKFFNERGFVYVHTPLITAADCEGAGEQFTVSTLLPDHAKVKDIPVDKQGNVDFAKDFFGRRTCLTVSGQLNVETHACALTDVYTFGPTFRAENSHTSRHLAEFWMIEPEICFAELAEDMALAEDYVRFCAKYALEHCADDLHYFEHEFPAGEKGLKERLLNVVNNDFAQITYTEAVALLQSEIAQKKVKFEAYPSWGDDLGSEHERYITEQVYKKPTIVINYPKGIKAFYMKLNDDNETVAAMDILVPKIGELIGGSQREDNLETLERRCVESGMTPADIWWYADLRRYGTVPHAGFGLGFERLVMFVTGLENIRDVISFPRVPGHAEF